MKRLPSSVCFFVRQAVMWPCFLALLLFIFMLFNMAVHGLQFGPENAIAFGITCLTNYVTFLDEWAFRVYLFGIGTGFLAEIACVVAELNLQWIRSSLIKKTRKPDVGEHVASSGSSSRGPQ